MLLVLQSVLHILKIKFVFIFINHLFTIPVALLLGLGKYIAFAIALVMNAIQLVVYYNVLNHTWVAKRFGWHIEKRLFEKYKKPEFFDRLHDNWLYVGVTFLSMMPVYVGGLFAAVFTAKLLRLDVGRSYTCISIGSLIGCAVWTIGIWNVVGAIVAMFT